MKKFVQLIVSITALVLLSGCGTHKPLSDLAGTYAADMGGSDGPAFRLQKQGDKYIFSSYLQFPIPGTNKVGGKWVVQSTMRPATHAELVKLLGAQAASDAVGLISSDVDFFVVPKGFKTQGTEVKSGYMILVPLGAIPLKRL